MSDMSQKLPPKRLQHTWGQFASQQAAETTKQKLETSGLSLEEITLETENQILSPRIEDTQAIANAKSGAIAGAIMGALIGLSLSLISADALQLGFAAIDNFNAINYLAPLLGSIVGAVGISLISALSGTSVPKSNRQTNLNQDTSEEMREIYLVKVAGTTDQIARAEEIIHKEGGKVGEESRR